MLVKDLPESVLSTLRLGTAIPALPLCLDKNRKFDERHQRALIRYYLDAGVGGIAVAVHSTQFQIREPSVGLFKPLLELVAEEVKRQKRKTVLIAGVCGKEKQAVSEAETARSLGYHACLASLAAYRNCPIEESIGHCRKVAAVMPVFGFYMQTAVGGTLLPLSFWRKFSEIENILGIKIAPFNRYQTMDVVRAVAESGRENEILLYTGNDDSIVADLLTEFKVSTFQGEKRIRIRGGLLGHWGVWTRKAVELLEDIKRVRDMESVPAQMLTIGAEVTDMNAVIFDAANGFYGCIPGIHEVLFRQGLMQTPYCLNPDEQLSPGQKEEIGRVIKAYPHLVDDDFVLENLHQWLS
jgi:dihydrodipicolinate synthase/N-acetylneuraminate lyase